MSSYWICNKWQNKRHPTTLCCIKIETTQLSTNVYSSKESITIHDLHFAVKLWWAEASVHDRTQVDQVCHLYEGDEVGLASALETVATDN